MRIGLLGFPLTGKSTLFQLLTGAAPPAHGGRGEAHVVRAFREDAIPHTEGAIDPARDIDTMETELILADHTIAEKRVEKLKQTIPKTNSDEDKKELELLGKCLAALESETPLRNLDLADYEQKLLRGYTFLSMKPLLAIVNADESDAGRLGEGAAAFGLEEFAGRKSTEVVALSAKIEAEIGQLDADDAGAFRADLGITDMEKGFIRAELVAFDELMKAGSWAACREAGTLRLEGKDYVVQDGDVINFRFNI